MLSSCCYPFDTAESVLQLSQVIHQLRVEISRVERQDLLTSSEKVFLQEARNYLASAKPVLDFLLGSAYPALRSMDKSVWVNEARMARNSAHDQAGLRKMGLPGATSR